MPPKPGMMPRFDSVCPIRAVSFRMRIWQAMAISQPPPSAWPLMAAITGFGKRSMRRTTQLPKRMKDATSGPEKAEPRSAPAQKILSPAPVMMTRFTAASDSSSDRAAFSSLHQRLADGVGGRAVEGDDREALLAAQDQGLVRHRTDLL